MPEAGFASIAYAATAAGRVSSPDPSFTAPIYASLFDDEDGETSTLIWSRSRKANAD